MSKKPLLSDRKDKIVQAVLGKLRFLSKLRPGERINVDTLAVYTGWYTEKVRRWWHDAGRKATIRFLQETFREAFNLANKYVDKPDRNKLGEIVLSEIENAYAGIKALKATYISDLGFQAKAEALEKVSCARVQELRKKIPGREGDAG
jgi:hypothetical protein